MLWAVLGTIEFLALGSPTGFLSERTFDYAKHKLVETRPQLQWVSDDLETIALEMIFHVMYARPKTMYTTLLAAAQDHNARALVFGNGDHRGYYVITQLNETFVQTADDGSRMSIQVHVDLEEVIPLPDGLKNPINGQPTSGDQRSIIPFQGQTGSQPALAIINVPPGSGTSNYDPSGSTLSASPLLLPGASTPGPPTVFSPMTYGIPGVSGIISPAPLTGPPNATTVASSVPASLIARMAP